MLSSSRKLVIKHFKDREAIYHTTPITTPEQIYALRVNKEKEQVLLAALEGVQADLNRGFAPKVTINFKTGDVYTEYFAMALALEKLGLRPGPSGVSCCLQSESGRVLGVKRSLKNNTAKGFLGPIAGFIQLSNQPATIGELIANEIIDQFDHESGLQPEEMEVKVIGVAEVDYPIEQSEVIVKVTSSLTEKEITERMQTKADQGLSKIAENDVRWLSLAALKKLLTNPELHIATAHAFCLAVPLYLTEGVNWSTTHLDIAVLPNHDPNEPWTGLDELLEVVGINYRPEF